jgi:ABC-type lipoprotein release transport system permease subunit
MLFRVEPHDAVSLAGAVVLLGAVAAIASYLPARRATMLGPLQALRSR